MDWNKTLLTLASKQASKQALPIVKEKIIRQPNRQLKSIRKTKNHPTIQTHKPKPR